MFTRHHGLTVASLTGFLLGSLTILWPWKEVLSVRTVHAGKPDEHLEAFSATQYPTLRSRYHHRNGSPVGHHHQRPANDRGGGLCPHRSSLVASLGAIRTRTGMKRFGLIGTSLLPFLQPTLVRRSFRTRRPRRSRYDLFELPTLDAFPALVKETPGLCGLNVTIPFKRSVMPLLLQRGPDAAAWVRSSPSPSPTDAAPGTIPKFYRLPNDAVAPVEWYATPCPRAGLWRCHLGRCIRTSGTGYQISRRKSKSGAWRPHVGPVGSGHRRGLTLIVNTTRWACSRMLRRHRHYPLKPSDHVMW
ncbi:MAG: hypothetical protein IPH05_08965 [Flavobacteriales bacterium]|nr:hypothetical protein [Flavobacteriales bacterium]